MIKNTRLVNAKNMLEKAKKEKYAIVHININNLEWTRAALEVAQENRAPMILGVSLGAKKYMGGYHTIVGMVEGLLEDLNITVPIALHLDHGTDVNESFKALDAGFSSVMYDGSHETIDVNVKNTEAVVKYAKKFNASVEAEVGTVGGEEDGVIGDGRYASLEECIRIAKTGITMLAASLGSVHGHYAGKPKLGFDEMVQYSKETNLPLVLHGGSGIPDEMIQKAIASGICKINVNTENQESFTKATADYFAKKLDKANKGYDPRNVLKPGFEAIKETIKEKITLFGSINKA